MASSPIDFLPPLRDVMAQHKVLARKSLGQHFLMDLNLTRKIVACAEDLKDHTVFEIGPGPGGLTRALLGTDAKKIIAIEKDRRCIEALAPLIEIAGGRLEVIEGDASEIDLLSLGEGPRAIVANLPYNIGTDLLLGWLKQMPAYAGMTLMFQKEVAARIVAAPHNKAYGRLSVISQFCCDVKIVLNLPASAFTPPPKVDSSVIHLTPRKDRPTHIAFEALEKVTASAFGQRRKMLRSSLKPLGGEDLLRKAGIAPELRAENLTVQEFEKLVDVLNV